MGMTSAIVTVVAVALFFAGLVGIVFYVFNSLALYTISKQRGYQNAWLAWIPVVNAWVLGGIVDNIDICCGKRSNYRVILLVLRIVSVAASGSMAVMGLGQLPALLSDLGYYGNPYSYYGGFGALTSVASSFGSLIGLAYAVFAYIAYYRIFQDYDNRNKVLYLVLSILFSIAPFFLFAIRNKPSASLYWASQRANTNVPPYQQNYPGNPPSSYTPPQGPAGPTA